MNNAARQLTLQRDFVFTCSCALCSLPPSLSRLSDARRDEIQRPDEAMGDGSQIMSSPLQALHNVRKLLRLYREESVKDASVPRAYYDAFQIAKFNGDMARAKVFAERAAATRLILEGDDSPMVRRMRHLARDPTQHSSFGESMFTRQWPTSINDIPSGLQEEEFETWLWRESEKTGKLGHQSARCQELRQYANLRDDTTFPPFCELPDENDIDLEYFESADGFKYALRKHWCFLTEVLNVEYLMRLRLNVKGRDGRETPVFFYTEDRGRSLLDSLHVQEGFTVAILYAEKHGFLDMTAGIRQEDSKSIKVSNKNRVLLFYGEQKVPSADNYF